MPCMKCANGKWKYGERGNCQFDTLAACKQAAAAIHIQNPTKEEHITTPPDCIGENIHIMLEDQYKQEDWQSGRLQLFAKQSSIVICSIGSNPISSAKL